MLHGRARRRVGQHRVPVRSPVRIHCRQGGFDSRSSGLAQHPAASIERSPRPAAVVTAARSRSQVPTSFEDSIEFAQLDIASEITLHCACTKGVEIRLEKPHDLSPENWTRVLDVAIPITRDEDLPDEDRNNPFLWRVLDITYGGRNTSMPWLIVANNGTVDEANLQLKLDATGLEEAPFADGCALPPPPR